MRLLFITFLLISFSFPVYSASVETITVGRCSIEVLIMETAQEHAKGLLEYTERTFAYGGMLFDLKSDKAKIFHTQGMKMPIRIMGVSRLPNGNYKVIGNIIQAPPGMPSIVINAPDILEIPESKYQLYYKRCLGAPEGK